MSDTQNTYYPTIGLEIHCELLTKTKMFCKCANEPFESEPNAHTCPVCMAHPGTLPVPNIEAIRHVVNVGLALNGTIANFSEFDRKNYFYPDIPKGYQISQYQHPIVSGGELAGVQITRVHLEEDTATSQHVANTSNSQRDTTSKQNVGTQSGSRNNIDDTRGDYTLINFNRVGVPLMELVTEPVIHSAEQAMEFAEELQLLFRYLGVSHANMEKGEMRVEVNISVSPDPEKFGTKVEIKNLNSFTVVGKAVAYEVKRMSDLWDEGKQDEIVQETRGWDDAKQKTFSQRKKESSADYRYFPEPDIPKFYLHELFKLDEMKKELPELPSEKRNRYRTEYGIKDEDTESYVRDQNLGTLFENTIIHFNGDKKLIQATSNIISNTLVGLMKKDGFQYPEIDALAKVIGMKDKGDINSQGVTEIMTMLMTDGGDPEIIAKEKGLLQEHDEEAIKKIAQQVIDANPTVVAEYKAGKENVIMFMVGQGMKLSKGSANPALLEKLLKEIM